MSYNPAIHNKILLEILGGISRNARLAPLLGLKGGTAAYMFYGLDRFSVDLDFDLLDPAKEEEVFEGVEKIIHRDGIVKDARKKRFNLFFLFSYEPDARTVKIEINRRNSGSQYELRTHLGISMLVMTKEDMFAHKLLAMADRIGKANRDIYDAWFFMKNNWPIRRKIVEQRSGMPMDDFLKKCVSLLENMSNKMILSGLGELLTEKQKVWAKIHLKEETIFLLNIMRDNELRAAARQKQS